MSVPFFNLTRQYAVIGHELDHAARDVLASGQYIFGPRIAEFERECAEYLGVKHAIGVASGTDSLELSLRALGIGAGDEVITTPFSFFATAEMITTVGATPIFVDLDDTLNLDPTKIEAAITERTRAIMPVHLFGLCAAMDEINAIAQRHQLHVIEDAAQAFGATLNGRCAGTMGAVGCYSFYPTKNLGACGDGGLVTTNDDAVAQRVRLLLNHGSRTRYYNEAIGCCSRLDAIQAALLSVKLPHLDEWNERRREIAERYRAALSGTSIQLPREPPGARHIYHQFTVRTAQRDRLLAVLKDREIGYSIFYPVPIHLQEAYASLGYKRGDFPATDRACDEVVSLPMFPELTDDEIGAVVAAVRDASR